MPKKIPTTIYITEKQHDQLKELNNRLKIPISEIIRQGIDMVLKKYDDNLSGQIPLPLFDKKLNKDEKK